ncbi:MAG: hypothetical protein V1874_13510 [Spirochaetota bacterium]
MKPVINTSFFKIFIIINIFIFSMIFISCKTILKTEDQNDLFLKQDKNAEEVFRVLIISNKYASSQMKFNDKIQKTEDEEGDQNIYTKLKDYDKINETCEGILTVWLYDSGKIMKIRPKTLTAITEINSLIVEDLKRWDFKYINNVDSADEKEIPAAKVNTFDIKYRVVLRKIQSDEEIMKEVMEKAKKEEEKKARAAD